MKSLAIRLTRSVRCSFVGALTVAMLLTTSVRAHAESKGVGGFFVEVAKAVLVEVLKDFLKEAATDALKSATAKRDRGEVVDADSVMRERITQLIKACDDETVPFEQRIRFYADRVDLFGGGLLDKDGVRRARAQYVKQFPKQSYQLVGFTKIEMTTDRKLVAVEYDITFEHLSPSGAKTSGKSHRAALVGDLESSPRFYAIKEWVHRD